MSNIRIGTVRLYSRHQDDANELGDVGMGPVSVQPLRHTVVNSSEVSAKMATTVDNEKDALYVFISFKTAIVSQISILII